jgi:hypothetical protein
LAQGWGREDGAGDGSTSAGASCGRCDEPGAGCDNRKNHNDHATCANDGDYDDDDGAGADGDANGDDEVLLGSAVAATVLGVGEARGLHGALGLTSLVLGEDGTLAVFQVQRRSSELAEEVQGRFKEGEGALTVRPRGHVISVLMPRPRLPPACSLLAGLTLGPRRRRRRR